MIVLKVFIILNIIIFISIPYINCYQSVVVAEEIHIKKNEKKNVKIIKTPIISNKDYILIALSSYERTKALVFTLSSIDKTLITNYLLIQLKTWKKELNKINIEYKNNNYKNILLLSNKLRTTIINYIESKPKIRKHQSVEQIDIEIFKVTPDEFAYGELTCEL